MRGHFKEDAHSVFAYARDRPLILYFSGFKPGGGAVLYSINNLQLYLRNTISLSRTIHITRIEYNNLGHFLAQELKTFSRNTSELSIIR